MRDILRDSYTQEHYNEHLSVAAPVSILMVPEMIP